MWDWMMGQVTSTYVFRAVGAGLTAALLSVFAGNRVIAGLHRRQLGQPVSEYVPEGHQAKQGTPTMGGLLIAASVMFSLWIWGDGHNRFLWVLIGTYLGFGLIGCLDDLLKISGRHNRGLAARWKYLAQSVFALVGLAYLYGSAQTEATTLLWWPWAKHGWVSLGSAYLILGYFVVVGSSNAVNLTDGLDGLAIVPAVLIMLALGCLAYVFSVGQAHPPLAARPMLAELLVFSAAFAGAGLGFLWFNAYPAQVFMGDVGALAIGAALGMMAMMIGGALPLFLMSGIFVLETLSVIIQVGSFKLRGGRRVFKMAPIHHHFELSGWPETRIIVRFWLITVVLVILALCWVLG